MPRYGSAVPESTKLSKHVVPTTLASAFQGNSYTVYDMLRYSAIKKNEKRAKNSASECRVNFFVTQYARCPLPTLYIYAQPTLLVPRKTAAMKCPVRTTSHHRMLVMEDVQLAQAALGEAAEIEL